MAYSLIHPMAEGTSSVQERTFKDDTRCSSLNNCRIFPYHLTIWSLNFHHWRASRQLVHYKQLRQYSDFSAEARFCIEQQLYLQICQTNQTFFATTSFNLRPSLPIFKFSQVWTLVSPDWIFGGSVSMNLVSSLSDLSSASCPLGSILVSSKSYHTLITLRTQLASVHLFTLECCVTFQSPIVRAVRRFSFSHDPARIT